MTREEIIEKIRKIQALASKGEAGERKSAELRLKEMMVKYGITEEDIAEEENPKVFFYKFHGVNGRQLFAQVAATRGCTRFLFIESNDQSQAAKFIKWKTKSERPRGTNVTLICTTMQFIEITTAYEVYQKSFDEHYKSFVYAFYAENKLFYGNADESHVLTDEEKKMLFRANTMRLGIERSEIHKQLKA